MGAWYDTDAPEGRAIVSDLLKRWVRLLAPGLFDALRRQTRRRRVLRRFLRAQGGDDGVGAPVVQHGPFAGMRFVALGTSSDELPMVLGCYEAELHEALEALLAQRPRVVVNIGCGEGYYAVGIARRLPDATVYAFDASPQARALCADVARKNGVADRVRVGAEASPDALAALDLAGALVICDCEGCEYSLLEPERVPGLKTASVIVELHRHVEPGAADRLLARFRATHDIELIRFTPECGARQRILSVLESPRDRALAAAERTMTDQTWAVLGVRARR